MTNMDALIRRAAGRIPEGQARDEQGRFAGTPTATGGLEGGNGRGVGAELALDRDPDRAMDVLVRASAGRYVGPLGRHANGISRA